MRKAGPAPGPDPKRPQSAFLRGAQQCMLLEFCTVLRATLFLLNFFLVIFPTTDYDIESLIQVFVKWGQDHYGYPAFLLDSCWIPAGFLLDSCCISRCSGFLLMGVLDFGSFGLFDLIRSESLRSQTAVREVCHRRG